MIELHYAPTPNNNKVALFLEESGTPYDVIRVDITKGDQQKPEYLAISPNGRTPAIVDRAPVDGGAPIAVFESGAILEYLADKTGQFLPAGPRARIAVLQWLYWQMAGLGPISGQAAHFGHFVKEPQPYAKERFFGEMTRLYGVLDRRLGESEYVGGPEYGIADMAIYPGITLRDLHGQTLDGFPNLRRWFDAIAARPAVERVNALAERHMDMFR